MGGMVSKLYRFGYSEYHVWLWRRDVRNYALIVGAVKKRLFKDIKDLVGSGRAEPGPFCLFFNKSKHREIHVNTWSKSEHLFHFNLESVHKEGVWNIHCTQFLTLPTVDTGIGYMRVPNQVEHEGWWNLPMCYKVALLCTALFTVTDWTVLDALITFDAP